MIRVALDTGVELDVWDSGPRDAPALIFLHGFPENHRTWRHQIDHLNTRYRCIAPDQRGYGNSSRPQEVDAYRVQLLIADVFALASALDLPNFTIVGHDWGGAIAWPIAIYGQAEGRVTRAVIANAPHPTVFQELLYSDVAQRAASQYIRAFRDRANDDLIREHGLGALLLKAIKWNRRAANDPAEQALLLEQWADPERAFAMLNWYRASNLDVPPVDESLAAADRSTLPDLPVLEIPTLVVWGVDDEALLPANIDGLGKVASDLTVERVENCGHFVPWEAPDAVNSALEAFLAKTD